MGKITLVHEKIDVLPFHKILSWERFQALCTDVLYNRYNTVDSREYLSKGNKQQGIDVYAVQRGSDEMLVAQCKLVDYLGPQKVIKIIDDFLEGSLVSRTKEFILCTSADLAKQKDEEKTITEARKKLAKRNIELLVWDERGLSVELRNQNSPAYVNLVYRYFNHDIALAFYGDVWRQYVRSLVTIEKKLYPFLTDYIERSVISYDEQSANKNRNIWDIRLERKTETLVSLIEQSENKEGRRIILLSTAGFGKTEEIKYAAGYFSGDEKLIYPVRFYLHDYEGQSIETILENYNPEWRLIKPENLLLLLDGVDEISAHHFQTYINQLNAFVELNPKVQVTTSSRYNFYDVKNPQLRQFEIYLLNPLTGHDIEKYINDKLGLDAFGFLLQLEERKFTEFSQNPYYLTRLVRFYNDKTVSFPRSQTELFARILFERLEKDENRYRIPELKNRLFPIAKEVAFCMTVSGKSALTEEEVRLIIPDGKTRQLLNHFSILNKNSATLGTWTFEHKNLQEYLCASVLTSLSFEKILNLISFEFNRHKLNPKFLNTVSFLFELLDKTSPLFTSLFSWIAENEPELLIRFEKEQLLKTTRFDIFKRIIQIYKDKRIPVRASTHFSLEELARFIEIDSIVIEFLIQEIQSGFDADSSLDRLSILSYCPRAFLYKKRLTSFLFSVLESNNSSLSVKAKSIETLLLLGFTTQDVFENIITSGVDLHAFDIRKACIFFLSPANYFESYSGFIIQSISILESTVQQSISSVPYYILKPLLMKFHIPKQVKELFQYFVNNKSCIDWHGMSREFYFEYDELKTLLQKAQDAYPLLPSILPVVYRLFCSLEHVVYEVEWLKLFKHFFETTCGTTVIFLKWYRYNKRQRELIEFADELCCLFLIDQYQKGKLTKEELKAYRNVLSHQNWNLFIFLYDRIKHLENGYFVIDDLYVDYNSRLQQQKDKNQRMLLDRTLFFDEAEEIFKIVGKDEMTYNDFWYPTNADLKLFQGSLVVEVLRSLCVHDDDKIISKEDLYKKYQNDDKWEELIIETTVRLVENKNEPPVREDLLDILRVWCKKRIEAIDFTKAINDIDDTYTYNPHVEYVKRVFKLIDIDLEDRLLLKMLPSDCASFFSWKDESKEPSLALKITKQIHDTSLLRQSVIHNIKQLDLATCVLNSHFIICYKLNYKECLPDLYDAITSRSNIKDYDRVTLSKYYTSLGGNIQDFASYLTIPKTDQEDSAYASWHWFLMEELQSAETQKVTDILLTIMSSEASPSHHLKAAEQLIRIGRIEGLEYWASYVKANGVFPFEHRWSFLQKYITKLPAIEAINSFISTFEFAYTHSLHRKWENRYNLQDSLQNSLLTLSGHSFQSYSFIKNEITRMKIAYQEDDFIEALIYFSEHLTKHYYETFRDDVDVNKSITIYKSILVDGDLTLIG